MDDIICRGLKDGDLALVHPGSSAPGWFASLAFFPFFSFPFSCLFPSCLACCLSRPLLLFPVCISCLPSAKHDSAPASSYNSQGKLTSKNGEFYIRVPQFYFQIPHFEGQSKIVFFSMVNSLKNWTHRFMVKRYRFKTVQCLTDWRQMASEVASEVAEQLTSTNCRSKMPISLFDGQNLGQAEWRGTDVTCMPIESI